MRQNGSREGGGEPLQREHPPQCFMHTRENFVDNLAERDPVLANLATGGLCLPFQKLGASALMNMAAASVAPRFRSTTADSRRTGRIVKSATRYRGSQVSLTAGRRTRRIRPKRLVVT